MVFDSSILMSTYVLLHVCLCRATDEGLLPETIAYPHSNFLTDVLNGAYLIGSFVLIIFPTWHVSLLLDHMSLRGHLSPGSISVYFGWHEILRSIRTFKRMHIQNTLLSIVKTLASSHFLANCYLDLIFDSSISINNIAWYWCWAVLMRVCYPKRSSSIYSNVIPFFINGAYLFGSLYVWNVMLRLMFCLHRLTFQCEYMFYISGVKVYSLG